MAGLVEIGDGFRGPDGRVSFLLRQAHTAFRGAIDRELDPLGITGPQFSVLNVVGRLPGLSGTELSKVGMLTQQTTNEILLVLERRRLVTRRPRSGNRRVLEVALTAEGRDIVVRARRIVYGIERRMVAGLGPADRARFKRWLVVCATSLTE